MLNRSWLHSYLAVDATACAHSQISEDGRGGEEQEEGVKQTSKQLKIKDRIKISSSALSSVDYHPCNLESLRHLNTGPVTASTTACVCVTQCMEFTGRTQKAEAEWCIKEWGAKLRFTQRTTQYTQLDSVSSVDTWINRILRKYWDADTFCCVSSVVNIM